MDGRLFTVNRHVMSQRFTDTPIVLTAHCNMQQRNDTSFHFIQEPNFWYLTGIDEADWQLVLHEGHSYLIAPEVDEVHQTFNGRLSYDEAKHRSGVDEVISADKGKELLEQLTKRHSTVYTLGLHPHRKYFDFAENPAQARLTRQLKRLFGEVKDCRRELACLRAIKQPEEVTLIRRSVGETCRAFELIRQKLPELRYEYEIEAEFSYEFRRHNFHHGYDPIVAAGINACTLHYIANDTQLHQEQLVLIDIGASKDGYSADITRTYAYGQATRRQQDVHAAVETAHHEIIDLLKPGYAIAEYLDRVDEIMKRALASVDLEYDDEQYRRYFPHAISHGLGIDVHDSLGGFKEFQPGMVLTVEPGIYVVDEHIGVRIEDDILITDDGHDNLSSKLSTALE